jgi:hypothetical protein
MTTSRRGPGTEWNRGDRGVLPVALARSTLAAPAAAFRSLARISARANLRCTRFRRAWSRCHRFSCCFQCAWWRPRSSFRRCCEVVSSAVRWCPLLWGGVLCCGVVFSAARWCPLLWGGVLCCGRCHLRPSPRAMAVWWHLLSVGTGFACWFVCVFVCWSCMLRPEAGRPSGGFRVRTGGIKITCCGRRKSPTWRGDDSRPSKATSAIRKHGELHSNPWVEEKAWHHIAVQRSGTTAPDCTAFELDMNK